MPKQDDVLSRGPDAPNAILTRMRRRTGRIGAAVALLAVVLAAAVVFAVCACKTVR
jgi:hypothetical protein